MTRSAQSYQKRYRKRSLKLTYARDTLRHLVNMLPLRRRYHLADTAGALFCTAPLFIISAGRSGTTLLRSMLVAEGQIAIPPETQRVHTAVRKFLSLQHLGWQDLSRLVIAQFESHPLFHMWQIDLSPAYQTVIDLPIEARCLARVVDEVFGCYVQQQFPDAVMWGDQSPIHTFFVPWISAAFPQAKFLHLLRDGRDAIASLVERGKYLDREFTLAEATHRWLTSVERARQAQKRLGDQQFLEIRYRDLVSEPEETLKRVCTFIDIAYRPRMLEYWKSPTTIEHQYNEYHRNIGKPVSTASIGKWVQRLSEEDQRYVLMHISDTLTELGYS